MQHNCLQTSFPFDALVFQGAFVVILAAGSKAFETGIACCSASLAQFPLREALNAQPFQ